MASSAWRMLGEEMRGWKFPGGVLCLLPWVERALMGRCELGAGQGSLLALGAASQVDHVMQQGAEGKTRPQASAGEGTAAMSTVTA